MPVRRGCRETLRGRSFRLPTPDQKEWAAGSVCSGGYFVRVGRCFRPNFRRCGKLRRCNDSGLSGDGWRIGRRRLRARGRRRLRRQRSGFARRDHNLTHVGERCDAGQVTVYVWLKLEQLQNHWGAALVELGYSGCKCRAFSWSGAAAAPTAAATAAPPAAAASPAATARAAGTARPSRASPVTSRGAATPCGVVVVVMMAACPARVGRRPQRRVVSAAAAVRRRQELRVDRIDHSDDERGDPPADEENENEDQQDNGHCHR